VLFLAAKNFLQIVSRHFNNLSATVKVAAFWNVVDINLSIFAKCVYYITNNNKQNAQNTTEFHSKMVLLPTACQVGGKLDTKTAETTEKQRKKDEKTEVRRRHTLRKVRLWQLSSLWHLLDVFLYVFRS